MNELNRVLELMDKYAAKNYHPLPVNIMEAQGCWVWTGTERKDEEKYLDCLASYSALNHGYNHPRLVSAALKQIATGVTVTSRAFLNTPMADLIELLADVCKKEKVLLMNTGAEAVESAIKIARKWAYQKKGVKKDQAKIIACQGNFHGRTTAIISFSSEKQYQEGFGPLTPGFELIPYGDIEALRQAIDENTAAFLIEPIQGEAGVIIPPKGFLAEAKKLCDKHNVLLMADEIQSGLGRAGALFACDLEGVTPHVYILGKAIGGGYPLSAVVCDDVIMDVLKPGDHGSTFGGNPFCSAIALEAIKVIIEEKLPDRSRELGKYFADELRRIDSPHVKEIRSAGLWIGIELTEESGGARRFCEILQDKHHILCKETHYNIIRMAPPLVISKKEIDWVLDKFRDVLAG
ncbi:MAG: ornithine--oxo-acid transaminase [Candidatus Cloacimonetes bacterium 4572_55]|nr:MAG: ornithine--oxo-acid transaminase [Candidatus Cloacimonetes bacterium 4572_55]